MLVSLRYRMFWVLSLAIATLITILVVSNYFISREALLRDLTKESKALHAAFRASMNDAAKNMVITASVFANDEQVQQFFLRGKNAVEREGGGAGGALAAQARKALFDLVSPRWRQATEVMGARQLHFHLAPGALSFLRVHHPGRFGDRMDEVRHIVVQANRDQSIQSGFETGRVSSGIRGVVPVFADGASAGAPLHVGVVEAGSSLDHLVRAFANATGVRVAILLKEDHIRAITWPALLEQRLTKAGTECGCVIEAASADVPFALLEQSSSELLRRGEQGRAFLINGQARYFAASIAPLRDFSGMRDVGVEPVGAVLLWSDATDQVTGLSQDLLLLSVFGLAAFVIIEALLLFGFRKTTDHLEREIALRAKALTDSERRWRFALDGARDGVWDWNVVSNQVFYSRTWKRMLGYEDNEIGSDIEEWQSRVHPDDLDRCRDDLQRHLRGETEVYQNEHRLRCKDGSYKWILDRGKIIERAADNSPLRIIGTHADVTSYRDLEARLKQNAKLYEDAQRIGKVGHWDWDIPNDSLTWSDQIYRIFDMEPGRFSANIAAFYDRVHPDDVSRVKQAVDEAINNAAPYAIDHRIQCDDGSIRYVHEEAETVRDANGRTVRMIGAVHDITARKAAEKELALTRYAVDHISEAAFLIATDGRFQYVNASACESLGYSSAELLSMGVTDIDPRLSPENWPERFEALKQAGTQRFEAEHRHRDGRLIPVEIVASFIRFEDKDYSFAVARDITALKAAQREVERQHALLQDVIDGVSDPILMIDTDYNVRLMNQAARQSAPLSVLAQKQIKCYQVSHHADVPCNGDAHPCPLRAVLDSGRAAKVVHSHRSESGGYRTLELLANPVLDSDGEVCGIIESGRDLTDYLAMMDKLKENESRLEHIAQHDPLTGLPNRLLFVDRLQQAIYKAKRIHSQIALLFIDLDRFKEVNDSYGHPTGDKLLKDAAYRLQSQIREEDTVARLGGDEFTVILDDVGNPQDAGKVAEKLLHAFQKPFEIDDHTFFLTSSIGISTYPQDGKDANTLIRNADSAMYNAKEQGRNAFCYYAEEMTAQAFERVMMETSLRGALSRQELELYYQPQVDMRDGRLVGIEALVRWNHPELGLVTPARFIPLAEESGLILPIGEWILERACRQAKDWLNRGLNSERISVNCNLSGRQMGSDTFHTTVVTILEHTGIDPELLELEITETTVMNDPERSARVLNRLRDLGIKLAIDDFGTGYSSLAYLKSLPISKLKIDQSFVRDVPNDPNDSAITRAVIALAKSLQMQVIAEGVETEAQARFLLDEGCYVAQGFLYARPMPNAEFESYLAARTSTAAASESRLPS